MKLLRHPVVLVLLGLIAGLGVGISMFMRAADAICASLLVRHAAQVEARKPAAPWGFWTIEMENVAS